MTIRINEKLRSIIISLITYAISLGIGFIIALFIEIPWYVSYPIFFVFGILAVAIDIPEDHMKWLIYIPILRRHFLMMHRVRLRIGLSAKEGKLKSAYKFVVGMIIIIVYLFFLNLAILSIKVILYYTIGYTADYNPNDPFRFTEAFLSLLGAGFTAYIIWLNSIRREYKKMRTMLRKRTFKDTMRSVGTGFTLIAKLYILFISYIIWMGGEILFFIGTIYYPIYFRTLLLGGMGFFFVMFVSLILIVVLTQPEKPEPIDSQPSEELTTIKSETDNE